MLDYSGLSVLLNQIPMGILLVNEAGEFRLCNEKFPQWMGLDSIDLMERGVGALSAEMGLAPVFESLRQAQHQQQEQVEVVRGLRRFSATVLKGAFALFDESCILMLLEDISEKRRLEDCRSLLQGEFLHRLRSSLTSVKTSLAVLASETPQVLPDPLREIVELGYGEVQNLHNLVQSVSELLAIESGSVASDLYSEIIDIAAFLKKFLRRFSKTLAARGRVIELEPMPTENPLRVVADNDKLGSALGHVLTNALLYSPSRSPVSISVALNSPEELGIRVRDFGRGIAAEDLPHVFKKFHRSRESQAGPIPGNGLGLFLAKSQLELMRGTLRLEPGVPRGTTAVLGLPLAKREEWLG